jgi:mono/diheme cytochrome c family protein
MAGVIVACLAAAPLAAQDANRGRKLYDDKDCQKCHQIAGKGNKIGKLDGIAAKLSAEEMRRWLTNPLEMEKALTKKPKVKMSSKIKQMNLTAADIEALVAYLQTLK